MEGGSTESLQTLSSYGGEEAAAPSREDGGFFRGRCYADHSSGSSTASSSRGSSRMAGDREDEDSLEGSTSGSDDEEGDSGYVMRRLASSGGERRVFFAMDRVTVHETHAKGEYGRLADFNPDLARLQWEEEEEEEWMRQLEGRWAEFERHLPEGTKCSERTEFESTRALLSGEPTEEKWARMEAMQEEARRQRLRAELEERDRKARETEAMRVVQLKIELRRQGAAPSPQPLKPEAELYKSHVVQHNAFHRRASAPAPLGRGASPEAEGTAGSGLACSSNDDSDDGDSDDGDSDSGDNDNDGSFDGGRPSGVPAQLHRSVSVERLLGRPMTPETTCTLPYSSELDRDVSFEELMLETTEDILFPHRGGSMRSSVRSNTSDDSGRASTEHDDPDRPRFGRSGSGPSPARLDSGLHSLNPSCESLVIPGDHSALGAASSAVSSLNMDQLQLLAKLIALEFRKTGFIPQAVDDLGAAGQPPAASTERRAADGSEAAAHAAPPTEQLEQAQAPSSVRPVPAALDPGAGGAPPQAEAIRAPVAMRAERPKINITMPSPKTSPVMKRRGKPKRGKRKAKAKTALAQSREVLDTCTDEKHRAIRARLEERQRQLKQAKKLKVVKARERAAEAAKRSSALREKASRIMSAEERKQEALLEKKRAMRAARREKEAMLAEKRKQNARDEKRRKKALKKKIDEKYKKIEVLTVSRDEDPTLRRVVQQYKKTVRNSYHDVRKETGADPLFDDFEC